MTKEGEEKKKRGRKPKLDKQPKKRGRKPKSDIATVSDKNKNKDTNNKIKRKTKQTSYGITTTSEPENKQENIILHLPVHTQEIYNNGVNTEFPEETETIGLKNSNAKWIGNGTAFESGTSFASYPFSKNNEIMDALEEPSFDEIVNNKSHHNHNHNISLPNQDNKPVTNLWNLNSDSDVLHTQNWNNPFVDQDNIDNIDNTEYTTYIESLNNPRNRDIHLSSNFDYNKKTELLMRQFMEATQRKEWPTSTPIHCFWCCHPFETKPCALPLEYRNEAFHVYGCFCSPECTASYNFNDFQDTEKRWERYSLLNRLYRKRGQPNCKIKLAPPRQTLQIFGGPLTIIQFRNILEMYDKTYTLNFPPLVSINVQQEQIHFDTCQFNKKDMSLFIPVDQDRVSEASENLKLKRKNPISETINTLESCMNLQFK